MKIAITGTHGAGKTTLCYLLAAHYKKEGKNVKVIDEVARDCPFPLNNGMTQKTVDWIYYEHSKRELEAEGKFDIIICDRTKYDSFVYGEHFNLKHTADYNHDYDKIILVIPDLKLAGDGTRSTDLQFQESVGKLFYKLYSEEKDIHVKSSDIFSEDEKWKSYCL